MKRNSFIEMSKLHNVSGRIDYIKSKAKQEYLYSAYTTEPDRTFWKELAKCNQEEFRKSGTDGKCIEARELVIALPEAFIRYDHDKLLKGMTKAFKKQYGVECYAALHHNKRKTNLHIHLIFAERKLLEQPVEKTASRNMFYDERGKHVRTKKEILDEKGNVRRGCRIIKKGEIYERQIFSVKDERFKQEAFLDEVKVFFTERINYLAVDEKDRLSLFDKRGSYLATRKIGKNNPKSKQIQADNETRIGWNREVDRALVSGVSEDAVLEIKKEMIDDRIKKSMAENGRKPELLGQIIQAATRRLEYVILKVMEEKTGIKEKPVQEAQNTDGESGTKNHESVEKTEQGMPQRKLQKEARAIPPQPKLPVLASKYPHLQRIDRKLQDWNRAIFIKEQEGKRLRAELEKCRGAFQAGKRKELQEQIADTDIQITRMKKELTIIVRDNGFDTVKAFQSEFLASRDALADYKSHLAKWERTYGQKAVDETSLTDILRQNEKLVKMRGNASQIKVPSKNRETR